MTQSVRGPVGVGPGDSLGVEPRLRALPPEAAVAPCVEPQAVAASALLAHDVIRQSQWSSKLDAMAAAGLVDRAVLADAPLMARAVPQLLGRLGGTWIRDRDDVSATAVALEAGRIREALVELIEHRLNSVDEARLWLETVRLGSGRVDLLLDLRSLGSLCRAHADLLGSTDWGALGSEAETVADRLEGALTAHDGPDAHVARSLVRRAWTLLLPAYREVCRVGSFLVESRSTFPSLASISRARRRERSSGVGSPFARRSMPPSSTAVPASPAHAPEPPTAVLITTSSVALPSPAVSAHATTPPIAALASERTVEAPALQGPEASDAPFEPQERRNARHTVELEVGIASESNLYLGFAENLSDGGIFVATYAPMPIGAVVDVKLSLSTSAEPLSVKGEVRWIRDVADGEGGWPGMGIRFATLSPPDEAALRAFLRQRDPLFFVE